MEHLSTYKFLVDGLIRQINANNVLEIGLGKEGHTAKICLDFFEEKETCKYVVLDFNPLPEALNLLSTYDPKKWELRIGDTTKDDNLFQNFHDQRFDLILIDGSHWITHVLNDITKTIIFGCAKNDTIFVFHDTTGSHVRHAVRECAQKFGLQLLEIPKANLILGTFKNH